MRWETVLDVVGPGAVVTTRRLRDLGYSAAECSRQLTRWTASGRLCRIQRGVYVVASAYRPRGPHPFELALALRDPSYVSLGSALRHHGVTDPRISRVVTAISTRRTETRSTRWADLSYRRLPPHLFRLPPETTLESGVRVRIAPPEQALCETIYFTSPGYRETIAIRFAPDAAERIDPVAVIEAATALRDGHVTHAAQGLVRALEASSPPRTRSDR